MSHRLIKQQLGDYLEGDLALETRETVERHLSDCTACTAEVDGLREVRTLLRGMPAPEPSPHLADAVMAQLRANAERRGPLARLSDWWSEHAAVAWPAPIAAAAMAMVALAVLRGGDLPLDPDRAPAPALARSSAPAPLSPEAALLLAGQTAAPGATGPAVGVPVASGAPGARTATALPPMDACLEAGRSPQDCLQWHSWMVGLAVREPHVFLSEVQRLPHRHQDAWMQQLGDFAQRSHVAPLLTRRIPTER